MGGEAAGGHGNFDEFWRRRVFGRTQRGRKFRHAGRARRHYVPYLHGRCRASGELPRNLSKCCRGGRNEPHAGFQRKLQERVCVVGIRGRSFRFRDAADLSEGNRFLIQHDETHGTGCLDGGCSEYRGCDLRFVRFPNVSVAANRRHEPFGAHLGRAHRDRGPGAVDHVAAIAGWAVADAAVALPVAGLGL